MSDMIHGLFPGVIKPSQTLAGCVDIYENVWNNPLQTIADVEKECSTPNNNLYWSKAAILNNGTSNYDQNERTNYDMGITYQANLGNSLAQKIHNEMYMLLLATTGDYNKRYGVHNKLWHEEYNMLKYSFGQEYHSHYDGSTGDGRSLSAILYLNDNYEGGQIEFVNFNITIKPTAGMLLLFPSNYAYRHKAHPVTSGTKYAIVTWLHDRPLQQERHNGVE
jgi:hypothetical protein